MQVQAIRDNNNFGSCKGIKCLESFNPREVPKHAFILDEFYKSPAFQKFGEKYDFIANFLHYQGSYDYDQYSLTLTPVATIEQECNPTKMSLFKSIKKLLSKNNSSDDSKFNFSVGENVEKSELPNLPQGFMVINCITYKNDGAYDEFIQEIKDTNIDSLNKLLSNALGEQDNTLKQTTTPDKERARQIIIDLEKQGIQIFK